MRISIDWLKEHVDFELEPEELTARLTMLGLEVEEIVPLDPGVQDVVVGRIVRVDPHPHADRLRVCRVDAGTETVEVVCGAPNTRDGLVAPLALAGAKLPNGMEVRATAVRGVESAGMLCSARELGLSDEAEGLMELPESLTPGMSLVEALGLDDTVLEVDIRPNRPDCLSIVGVARDLAAVLNVPYRVPEPTPPETGSPVRDVTQVDILDPSLCPRYAARVVLGVTIGPSPVWMQRRLHAAGIRSINNVVDVTNFVLMELGHPLHAFDYDLLAEKRIVVRRALSGERLTTLDGEDRRLTTETLVIADAEKAIAVAGIMGGHNSEVTETTTNIFLESAYFNPISIRRTAKALGMQTEASYRFERGADPEMVVRALDRAAELIVEVAGGEICAGVLDVYPEPIPPVSIAFRPARANELLGTEIPTEEMTRILNGLGFKIEAGEPFTVTAPTYRPDVTREIDLIEEIARVYSYDAIPTTLPVGAFPSPRVDPMITLRERIGRIMQECGLNEALNYAWDPPDALDRIRLAEKDPLRRRVEIANPLTKESAHLRTTLLPSLLQNVHDNRRFQIERVRLYELQRIFLSPKTSSDDPPKERWTLAGVLYGPDPKHWAEPAKEPDFYDVKGIIETLFDDLGMHDWTLRRTSHPTFHPGRAAEIEIEGNRIAVLGEVHPAVRANYEIPNRTFLFEVDVAAIADRVHLGRAMNPLPPFPSTTRDLAILLDADVPAAQVQEEIEAVGGDILGNVRLFDVYTGERIPEGKKSLAFSLEYRSPERTLTDAEVDAIHQQIVEALEDKLGATLRT